jgi:hypothetical protein
MSWKRALPVFAIVAVLALSLVLLAGCEDWDPEDAGEDVRREAEDAAEQAQDFCSGLCGTSALPVGIIALPILRRRLGRGR